MKKLFLSVCFLFVNTLGMQTVLAQDTGKAILQKKTENKIQEVINGSSAIIGMAVVDLKTGEQAFTFNSDFVFPQASAIKIPILVEIFKKVHEGNFSLTDQISIESSSLVGGTGILKELEGELSMSIQNLSTLMIALSDNSATNILIELVGMSAINQTLEEVGAKKTRIRRKMMAIEASAKERENTSTPNEAVQMLQMLYDGAFINAEISSNIISMLKKAPRHESRIADGLPDEVPIAFKPGELAGVSTEWALVLLDERPYAVAMMENYKVDGEDSDSVEKISKIIYDHFWRMGNSTRYGVYRDPELMQ
jgi:beta-lactamase class A